MEREDGIVFRPATIDDYETLRDICERRLGDGYLGRDDYEDRVKYPELNMVADHDGRAVAFVSMTPESVESLSKAMKYDEDKILEAAGGKPVIHFRTAIADEHYDGKGLISSLLSMVVDQARNLGYGLILSPTWKYDGKVPAARVQEKVGFKPVGDRKLLWVHQKGYTCIACKGPCRCDAVLYQLVL